jgi:thiol-disulfide isomerase/thioredoxin
MRRVKVSLLLAALLALTAALAFKAWDILVAQPQEPFDIARLAPLAAPELKVETREGGTFSLEDAKGQVVFLNFWATWCPPCRDEMPSMVRLGQQLALEYPGKFRMVAVSVDEGWDVIQQFFGGAPPQGLLVTLDQAQRATKAYYCAARGGCPADFKFPESYILDRQGRLVAYVVGPRDWSHPSAGRFLRGLLD